MNLPEASPGSEPATGALPSAAEFGEKFISFELHGRRFCVAASAVAEVVQPMPVAAVPNSPKWLLGLGPYRGEPVAVIDPRVVAGPDHKSGNPKAKTVVFRSRANETQFALPIDSLYEMISVDRSRFDRDSNDGSYLSECVHNDRPLTLIAHKTLFAGLQ